MLESFGRPDFKEGVVSFLQKRPPRARASAGDGRVLCRSAILVGLQSWLASEPAGGFHGPGKPIPDGYPRVTPYLHVDGAN